MNPKNDPSTNAPPAGDRMVLLVSPEAGVAAGDSMNLLQMWNILWKDRWLVIAITASCAIVSIVYALLATQWWRADVVLVQAHQRQGLSGQLGSLAGLASLAGLNISERGDSAEALAVLRSREFTQSFIEEQKLLPVLFADKWDAKAGRWKSSDPEQQPDVRDAIKLFENRIRSITENKKTGVITLGIEWKDKVEAARWANLFVERANDRMRSRAQIEAERNVKFLREEATATTVVTLQQSISRLLEHELETLMLARGNKEFAFRVVDRATVPKWRSSPKRTLTVVLATMAGGLLSLVVVYLRHVLRRQRASAGGTR
jgi:uncharacterized protein involved in exopolysaccharide biosynthesis